MSGSTPIPGSTQDPRQPIVAIDPTGGVTRANGPARRFLTSETDDLEGLNLGALVAGYLSHPRQRSRVAKLTLPETRGIERSLSIVVSQESIGQAPGREQSITPDSDAGEGGRFADYIAHELKNPVATIRAVTTFLLRRQAALSLPDRLEALETIQAEAARCLLILDALLRLMQSRRFSRRELSPLPLHALVRHVVVEDAQRKSDRTFHLSGDSPVYVKADRVGLELAIENLLDTAQKFAQKGTAIDVVLHGDVTSATVLVISEGQTLAPERYSQLWDIQAQVPDTDVSTSGIGLSLCKELIETMGGRVWAGPSSQGSAFSVTLPVAREATREESGEW